MRATHTHTHTQMPYEYQFAVSFVVLFDLIRKSKIFSCVHFNTGVNIGIIYYMVFLDCINDFIANECCTVPGKKHLSFY